MNVSFSPSSAILVPRAAPVLEAARALLLLIETGKSISTDTLRSAIETAYGDSDANGAWVWKDAYEALECAQILFILKYGAHIRRQAADPVTELGMLEKIAALVPSQTRRSEESQRLQQFSTPLPLAFVAAHAAGLSSDDLVLEPSAGTGLLACFAKIAGAGLILNEIAEDRAHLLAEISGQPVTRHDAASIYDRLEPSLSPSVVLMNPPFSTAPNVDGRFRAATMQHVRSVLAQVPVIDNARVNIEQQTQSWYTTYQGDITKVKGASGGTTDSFAPGQGSGSPLDCSAEVMGGDTTQAPPTKRTHSQQEVARMVEEEAIRQGVDPNFAMAIAEQESRFRQSARSPVGATGVMQLMPGTARELGVNPYDTRDNIRGGVKYIKKLQGMFGNRYDLIAAGYNAGCHRAG
ncbi:transglycosylase SLT domain-containing protein [Sinorhizobium alkalisoli]|uniref:transglycosylase SLT domain-containing protein n=1 Tax=Sinorhizobium alkalisoli TaxID=1752398 RepID=UPI000A9C3568|nr:transglycosylase SLT domain-containing protein [Sinorhizobium alkalisoli]